MLGRNYGICHCCRAKDHYFAECKKKRLCSRCERGFEKCFVVEKGGKNKGKLFICCSNNCGYWDWVVKEEESSGSNNPAKNETIEEMSRTFQSRVRISDDKELHISVNVTIAQVDAKGKHPVED